jgi:hypothetical protein
MMKRRRKDSPEEKIISKKPNPPLYEATNQTHVCTNRSNHRERERERKPFSLASPETKPAGDGSR